jgi:hypothetical protein
MPRAGTTTSSRCSSRTCRRTQRLKVGLIYSYGANDAVDDGILDDEASTPTP